MIHTNELRIGNWVNTTGGYQWIDYLGVDPTLSDGDIRDYEQLEPIPLTPEILEKAGFERTVGNNYVLEDFRVWINQFPDGTNVILFFYKRDLRIEIKHLHQLQNVCFALTGEELTINL